MKKIALGLLLVFLIHANDTIEYKGLWGDWGEVFQAPEGYFACGVMARL